MRKFILATLALVIIVLLYRNASVFTKVVKTVTDIFGKSFRAVTEVGDFK